MTAMFSVSGPGLKYNSEVECSPHACVLEQGGPSHTSVRVAELDQGLGGGGY